MKDHNENYAHCVEVDFKLRWATTVNSPVFSTPIVFPRRRGNQELQLFLSSYYQYIELIDCDGFKPWGWPISFEDSSFQSSPLLYDIDSDGNIDIGVVDKNANLFWIRTGDFGEYLENYHIQVPGLKVKRNWAEHLDPNFVDSSAALSMFDRKRKGSRYWDQPTDAPNGVPSLHKKIATVDELNNNVKRKGPIVVVQDTYPELSMNTTTASGSETAQRRRLLEETDERGQEQEQEQERRQGEQELEAEEGEELGQEERAQAQSTEREDQANENGQESVGEVPPIPDLADIESLPPQLAAQDDITPPDGRLKEFLTTLLCMLLNSCLSVDIQVLPLRGGRRIEPHALRGSGPSEERRRRSQLLHGPSICGHARRDIQRLGVRLC